MSKSTKPKRVAKKPVAQVKKAKKPVAKAAPAKKAAKSVEPMNKRGFMWKLLEHKEKQLKEQSQKNSANPFARHDEDEKPNTRHHSFSKFAGPRRRVG